MSEKIHDHRKVYLGVFLALLTLTVLTVWVAFHDFGLLNIVVAMGIATIKGSLVCLYFMHLRYDNRLNQVIFIASFVFLAIFVGLTLSDELTRSVEKPGPVAAEATPSR